MSTLSPITSAEYGTLNAKIGAMLSSNRKPSISIYMDEAGTIPAKDAAGNDIVDLIIVSVSITQSYLDSVTNEPVNASLTLSFSDRSFKVVDNTATYYYAVGGTDFPIRTI